MPSHQQIPIALTIAGSDSGGGAGIQADLKTFAALGVHGTTAITCLTAQNPRRVSSIHPCPPAMVRRQIEAVFDGLPPAAVKTGMLHSTEIILTIARCFQGSRSMPIVVDPVMVATSGSKLLQSSAIRAMQSKLLPLAALVTPNVQEAAILLDRRLKNVEDLRRAARELHHRFGCAALVKGGHLPGMKVAADIFYDGRQELLLSASFIKGVRTHGTGCTFSAAITAFLALGLDLPTAVTRAKRHITQAIAHHQLASQHPVLNNNWVTNSKS